jgi:antitoxin Phd
MKINTDTIVSMTEANQNFSKVARLVDEKGVAVIMKNNTPRYVVMEFKQLEEEQHASDEDVLVLSKRYMDKNRRAYLELAK